MIFLHLCLSPFYAYKYTYLHVFVDSIKYLLMMFIFCVCFSLLLRRHFRAWHRLPEEAEKEKERERRREELRQKVASLLPDFEPTISVNESSEFR